MSICKIPDISMELNLPVVTTKLSYDSSLYVDHPIRNCYDAIGAVEKHLTDCAGEHAYALICDDALYPLCVTKVGLGSQDHTNISVRDIIRTALLCNGTFITLIHNHPRGEGDKKNLKPSEDDIGITYQLSKCCSIMGLILYDSLIVQRPFGHEYLVYSMRAKSILGKKWIPIKENDFKERVYRSRDSENIEWGKVTFENTYIPEAVLNNKEDLTYFKMEEELNTEDIENGLA